MLKRAISMLRPRDPATAERHGIAPSQAVAGHLGPHACAPPPGGACLAAVASCRAGDLEMDAAPPSSSVYRFGDFVLDRRAGALFRVGEDGSRQEAPLGSRAFALACVLVERRGGIGSRREIMDAVWPGLAV